jgi:SAM-dependent methyltransferase
VILLGAAVMGVGAVAVRRHLRAADMEREVTRGILLPDAVVYDSLTRVGLGSFFSRIAEDVTAAVPHGARVLEVGCGPGHLSIRLARRFGLDVAGVDLDPAMIERARAKADRSGSSDQGQPTFLVGDVASLSFPDGAFDLVVTTLSMHHWADPAAGLAEIARVLRPGGRALVWDFRPGALPFHRHVPDPGEHLGGSQLRVVSAQPWRWPWRFTFMQRIELVRAEG